MKQEVKGKLEELTVNVVRSSALNNNLYDAWFNKPFNIEELRLFTRNYGEWVKSFPKTLAILFVNLYDSTAQTEIASTLNSEMGYGNPEKAHWKLLDYFMNKLSIHLEKKCELDRSELKKQLELLPTTKQLIDGERELYGDEDRRKAVGAQLALEWQAYHMLSKLHEGAQRNYSHLWPSRIDFDRDAEYFLIHLIAEKDHERESLEAAKQHAKSIEDVVRISFGFNQHLDLIANFWDGLYQSIRGVKNA